MPLPPDRAHIQTEQRNPRSMNLHALSTRECVDLFNTENCAVLEAMERAAAPLAAFIDDLHPRFSRGGRLIYFGAGTSGRLGVLDASECPPTFQLPEGRVVGLIAGGDASLRKSSEGREDDPLGAKPDLDALNLTSDDTLLGIAAGGTTPYVLGALEHAKAMSDVGCRISDGKAPLLRPHPTSHIPHPTSNIPHPTSHIPHPTSPLTGLLSCSPIPRPASADHLIVLDTGPEVLTGSTRLKAGTATKLALNTITTTLMVRTGRVYQNLMVDVRATNDKLRDRAARIVSTLTGLPRDEAFGLLDRAGGSVKAAVVMHSGSLDRTDAEALLLERGGRLGAILR